MSVSENNADKLTKLQNGPSTGSGRYNLRSGTRRQVAREAQENSGPLIQDPATTSSQRSEPEEVTSSNSHAFTESSNELRTRTAVTLILLIFLSSVATMFLVYSTFPEVGAEERPYLKFPRDMDDAKHLGSLLSRYSDKYFMQVYAGFLCTYVFLQTFAIPGSIFLSIISGFLFPFPLALFSVCLCSALGASFCYLLSYLVGRRLVRKYLPQRANNWALKVDRQRGNLLSYIIFLRITPFLPNWFINIVSPVIGVPLMPFAFGSFLGVAPPSFVFIQAGTTLHQLTSTMDPITVESVCLLVVFALLSLVPVFMKNRLKTKFEWLTGPQGLIGKLNQNSQVASVFYVSHCSEGDDSNIAPIANTVITPHSNTAVTVNVASTSSLADDRSPTDSSHIRVSNDHNEQQHWGESLSSHNDSSLKSPLSSTTPTTQQSALVAASDSTIDTAAATTTTTTTETAATSQQTPEQQ